MFRIALPLLTILVALPAWAGPAPDMDSDGTPDVLDICKTNPNVPVPNGCDTDMDGYGNGCDADHNNDNVVGLPDFGLFGAAFGSTGIDCSVAQDYNGDNVVGLPDFGTFGASFGGIPGPSGLSCAGTVPCP